MQITAKVDVKPVATYYNELAVVLRQSLPRTLKFEAAATVKKAMEFVKSSQSSEVKAGAIKDGLSSFSNPRIKGYVVFNKKQNYGEMFFHKKGERYTANVGIYPGALISLRDHTRIGWRLKNNDWNEYKSIWDNNLRLIRGMIKDRQRARGLTLKSWYDILLILNSDQASTVSAFVQRARPISGKTRTVGFALELGANSSQPQVTITNTSGIAIATGGDRKLQSAITIRRKFFMDSFEKGFLTDAKFVARNYPWAKVA